MLIDLEEVHELTSLINQPTHVTTTSQTLLDVILVNSPNSIKVSGVAELGLSDHRLVYELANKGGKHHEARNITCRSTKHLDVEELKADMRDITCSETQVAPARDLYLQWKERFMKIIDKHLLVKRIRVRKNDVPYMNAEWKAAIRKKRKLAKKFSRQNHRVMGTYEDLEKPGHTTKKEGD